MKNKFEIHLLIHLVILSFLKHAKKNRSENIYGFMGVLSPVHNAPSMIIYERGLNCLSCDARHGGDTRSHVVQSVPNSNGVKL